MPINDVTIAITSLLRPGYLRECLAGIAKNIPEAQVWVADDSDTDVCAHIAGPQCIRLPFDSGLTVKRNATVALTRTPYWLCGSDDFDFSPDARKGIEKLVQVLDENPDVDVASGRVDNNPYEGFLDYAPGAFIRETRAREPEFWPPRATLPEFYPVDITVNYFLARVDRIIPWDETIRPIGGEHGDWFLGMKEAGRRVVWVPSVNIDTFKHACAGQDPRYNGFRRRAFQCGHAIMKAKRNIQQYIGFDGGVS